MCYYYPSLAPSKELSAWKSAVVSLLAWSVVAQSWHSMYVTMLMQQLLNIFHLPTTMYLYIISVLLSPCMYICKYIHVYSYSHFLISLSPYCSSTCSPSHTPVTILQLDRIIKLLQVGDLKSNVPAIIWTGQHRAGNWGRGSESSSLFRALKDRKLTLMRHGCIPIK